MMSSAAMILALLFSVSGLALRLVCHQRLLSRSGVRELVVRRPGVPGSVRAVAGERRAEIRIEDAAAASRIRIVYSRGAGGDNTRSSAVRLVGNIGSIDEASWRVDGGTASARMFAGRYGGVVGVGRGEEQAAELRAGAGSPKLTVSGERGILLDAYWLAIGNRAAHHIAVFPGAFWLSWKVGSGGVKLSGGVDGSSLSLGDIDGRRRLTLETTREPVLWAARPDDGSPATGEAPTGGGQ